MNKAGLQAERFRTAKEDAFRYLSYRPRTVLEVDKQLAGKGYENKIIDLVINFLLEYRFLDDESFARMWIKSRTCEKPCGRYRIRSELLQKGVAKDIVDRCLAELTPQQEEDMAAALVTAKCRRVPVNYRKLKGFLLRRGFHPETVNKVLAGLATDHTDW